MTGLPPGAGERPGSAPGRAFRPTVVKAGLLPFSRSRGEIDAPVPTGDATTAEAARQDRRAIRCRVA
jgi:hypothetical protein